MFHSIWCLAAQQKGMVIFMKKQAFNPFLPLDVYIPDGEPHVIGDRIYIFGSHDREQGETFCMEPYMFYSAPLDDLTNWTCPGISYDCWTDPAATEDRHFGYAPDVVQGKDGRFYLYYCLGGYQGPISVAVSNKPDGKYEFLGHVRNVDGSAYHSYIPFDPAIINDDGVIRLYHGALYPFENYRNVLTSPLIDRIIPPFFGKTPEEIKTAPDNVMGPVTVTLADDMLTVTSEPKRLAPVKSKGTCWQDHAFYEGSSIRKINGLYYFIYSSWLNHELCYATSKYPDRDFVFRGTIVSSGDVGLNGRKAKDRLNHTGTTHGSIECVNGQWYVFYHRLTHGSDYSRQACAEPITIAPDGSIAQVEVTSCGLNGGPLKAEGVYPAVICCNLTNGKMPHGSNKKIKKPIPCVNSDKSERFLHHIGNGTWIGYKYFHFTGEVKISVTFRGQGNGKLNICRNLNGPALASISVIPGETWQEGMASVPFTSGDSPLFFHYVGKGTIDILQYTLTPEKA